MIKLEQKTIENSKKPSTLFSYLKRDTEVIDFRDIFDCIVLREEETIGKPWTGQVNIAKKTFTIVRSKAKFLKAISSSIMIKGEEISQGEVRVSFGVSWLNVLFYAAVASALMLISGRYFLVVPGSLIVTTVITVYAALLLLEFRRTKDEFNSYLQHRSIRKSTKM